MKKTFKSIITIILAITMLLSLTAFAKTPDPTFSKINKVNDSITLIDENLVLEKNAINLHAIDKEFIPREELSDIGKISIKSELTVLGTNNPLYCTFDSPTEALTNIKLKLVYLLALMEENYSLEELTSDNWTTYYKYIYELRNDLNTLNLDSKTIETLFKDSVTLEAFFDIYENDFVNDEILNLVTTNRTKALSNEDTEKLIMALPYNSPIVKNYNRLKQSTRSISGFNISRGVSYAETYATSPNPFYYYFDYDCTNFTSQILEAGGVRQTSTWWHTTNGQIHDHSRSWTVANDFCNYWGVDYETKDFNSFSSNIRKGDFIAYDAGDDGSWGHCAFVTNVGGRTSSGYIDFKVAQHTSDYHEWVSSSKNGWENLGRIPYGIIRG